MPDFLFTTCQIGAEKSVKGELARRLPEFRFAYSMPGFLTFKLPKPHRLELDFDLESVFARAYGFSIGNIEGDNVESLVPQVWETVKGRTFQRIHVWERDQAPAGDHGYEPSITPAAKTIHQLLFQHCPKRSCLGRNADDPCHPARHGELVLDCILLSPNKWWLGFHQAHSIPSSTPGGMLDLEMPPEIVSRAWLKMEEALRWSQLPIPRGARVAEIGSAPGGASQALLARGFYVTGIDPAEMATTVLNHPRFTHIRRRSTQVPRRALRKIRWLTVDMNVAPNYTLDAVESIITHPEINIRGLLLTLKLPDWRLSDQIPSYLERVRKWGYNIVQARQLQFNRCEICVAGLQKPFIRKPFKE